MVHAKKTFKINQKDQFPYLINGSSHLKISITPILINLTVFIPDKIGNLTETYHNFIRNENCICILLYYIRYNLQYW